MGWPKAGAISGRESDRSAERSGSSRSHGCTCSAQGAERGTSQSGRFVLAAGDCWRPLRPRHHGRFVVGRFSSCLSVFSRSCALLDDFSPRREPHLPTAPSCGLRYTARQSSAQPWIRGSMSCRACARRTCSIRKRSARGIPLGRVDAVAVDGKVHRPRVAVPWTRGLLQYICVHLAPGPIRAHLYLLGHRQGHTF